MPNGPGYMRFGHRFGGPGCVFGCLCDGFEGHGLSFRISRDTNFEKQKVLIRIGFYHANSMSDISPSHDFFYFLPVFGLPGLSFRVFWSGGVSGGLPRPGVPEGPRKDRGPASPPL